MRYIPRTLTLQLRKAMRSFPAVLLTGPRQCGKTTLLRHACPNTNYVLLEDPDVIARVNSDPRTFLGELECPVILDEIQNTPALLGYIRSRIDTGPKRKGQWLLTGSQEAPLMQGVTESMAGRVAVLQLLPLSSLETPKVTVLYGGYPDVVAQPTAADLWFRSYIQTYLERDVRAITAIRDLSTFRRFLALLASRHGSTLNKTDLAAPLGVSVPTISSWLNVLEITGQIILVPPFYENFGKRLLKTPKLYFTDSGLVCHMLGIDTKSALEKSPFYGTLFEGFVAAEIIKQQLNGGRRRELYYFRDQQGLEIDFVAPQGASGLLLIEVKATKTPKPAMAQSLKRLAGAITAYQTRSVLIHAGSDETAGGSALSPGVSAVSLPSLLKMLR
jgi:predicted AAA+ superfamily ATPase